MVSMHLKGVHAVSWGISASQINICICVALPLEAGFKKIAFCFFLLAGFCVRKVTPAKFPHSKNVVRVYL